MTAIKRAFADFGTAVADTIANPVAARLVLIGTGIWLVVLIVGRTA